MSQQAVSAVIIQNSARVPTSWLPHKLRSLKILGPLFLMTFSFLTIRVEFFAIFSYCLHFAKFVCLLCHNSLVAIILPPPPPPPLHRPLRLKSKDSLSRYFKTWYGEKIINDFLYLPFFLLFILWCTPTFFALAFPLSYSFFSQYSR
jgi:hypothetical protein